MRRAARVDRNQSEIVDALRKIGCSVTPTHRVSNGFPDLTVGFSGINLLMEIKDGLLPPSGRKLTEDEAEWHENWRGQKCIIESVEQALRTVHWFRTAGKV